MNNLVKKAFTLIELLVVIAIIGILSGLIVVSMGGMTQKATIAKAQVFSNSLRNSLLINLVSEWKFDGIAVDNANATSNDVLDTWENINNGTVSATPPKVRTGSNCVSGSCLQFDGSVASGSYNYIDFGNNSSLSMGLGDATVSFWARFDNALAPQHEMLLICGGNIVSPGYAGYDVFRYNGKDQLYAEFSDGSANNLGSYLSPSGSIVANNWYNIVVVFDRNVSAQAYINGVKQTGYSLDITPQQGTVQNSQSLRAGAWTSSSYRLAGKMDEIRLYNAALTTSQIKEQYYAGLNKLLAIGAIGDKDY